MRWTQILIVLSVSAAAGCHSEAPLTQTQVSVREVMKALMVADIKQRDIALTGTCRDAANIGATEAVLLGIPRINDKRARDLIAEECAQILHDNDENQAAAEVAQLISDEKKRTEVLAKVAPDS